MADLVEKYPDTFRVEVLDVRDVAALRSVVDGTAADFGRIDVAVNNAGCGLFGAAEELSDDQVDALIATNLTGSIQLIRAVLPHMRAAGGGRIIQLSSYGGQVAFPGNSMYHATNGASRVLLNRSRRRSRRSVLASPWSSPVALEPNFVTAARKSPTRFRLRRHTRPLMREDARPNAAQAPGDPARMAKAVIDSANQHPAPLRIVLGSQALDATITTLQERIASFQAQKDRTCS